MTVKELKTALEQYPDDWNVFIAERETVFRHGLLTSVTSKKLEFSEHDDTVYEKNYTTVILSDELPSLILDDNNQILKPSDQSEAEESTMEEYAGYQSDKVHELFSIPAKELKPLEDLYRKENPRPDGRFYLPDTTMFYRWIKIKILGY